MARAVAGHKLTLASPGSWQRHRVGSRRCARGPRQKESLRKFATMEPLYNRAGICARLPKGKTLEGDDALICRNCVGAPPNSGMTDALPDGYRF